MGAGTTQTDAMGDANDTSLGRNDQGTIAMIEKGHRRIAYCECGAQLSGDSERELFNAAQRHLAHHHPQLLGALELGLVQQMAEDVRGSAAPGGVRGR